MGENIRVGLFACFLLLAAGQDLKKKEVNVWVFAVFGILAIGVAVIECFQTGGGYDWLEHVSSASLGLGLLGAGMMTGGKIGSGDGWFFVISGIMLGFWDNFMILSYAIILSGVFCLFWFAGAQVCGTNIYGKHTVPFLPFVAIPSIYIIVHNWIM